MAPHITCQLVQNPHWLCPLTPYLPIPLYKIIGWQPLATPSCFWVNFQPQNPSCGYKSGCKPSNLYIWDVVPTIVIHKPNSNIYFLSYNLINYNSKDYSVCLFMFIFMFTWHRFGCVHCSKVYLQVTHYFSVKH